MDDQPVPLLATEAAGAADGDYALSPEGTVTVIDEIAYANLVPGKTYTVKGTLMDKATGQVLLVGGEEVTAEKDFSPIAPFGTVKVEFTFDAIALAGKEIVAFESLEHEGIEVATHADIYDEGQTVKVEPKPEIGTIATDAADGDHEAVADDDVAIIDEVRYENLEPGREYVLTGTLIDKTTANPVEVDGLPLTTTVAFTPTEPNGSVEVSFSFNGSELAGHRMVAFESLALDGDVVATHKDIEDEGQSVDLVEKPGPGNLKTGLAQTGDTNKIIPLVCLAALAVLAATLAALRGKRRNHASGEAESEEKEEDSEEEDGKDE